MNLAITAGDFATQAAAAAKRDRKTAALPGPDAPGLRPGTVKPTLAAETLRLYAGDWACFEQFCAERGERKLPATPALVAAFLAMQDVGKAALSRRLAAIDHHHRQRGLAVPGADSDLRAALRQARRMAPTRARDPAPTPAVLTQMAARCRSDLTGKRDQALLLLLASGLRRTAVVALQAEQLRFEENGVRLISLGDGGAHITRVGLPAGAACPVRALEDWLRSSDTRYGPVFRKINRWGHLEHQALGADAIRLILLRRRDADRTARAR